MLSASLLCKSKRSPTLFHTYLVGGVVKSFSTDNQRGLMKVHPPFFELQAEAHLTRGEAKDEVLLLRRDDIPSTLDTIEIFTAQMWAAQTSDSHFFGFHQTPTPLFIQRMERLSVEKKPSVYPCCLISDTPLLALVQVRKEKVATQSQYDCKRRYADNVLLRADVTLASQFLSPSSSLSSFSSFVPRATFSLDADSFDLWRQSYSEIQSQLRSVPKSSASSMQKEAKSDPRPTVCIDNPDAIDTEW